MGIKRFIYFVAWMLLTLPIAFAQSTTVNGTIVDPGGNIWANAIVTAQFQQAPNTPGPYTWSGGAYNPQPAPVIADSTGAFSITLPSNTAIVPSGSTWQFSVAPNATLPAAIVNVSLSGGTLNLIPIINGAGAWPTGNIPGTFINKAYNVTQVGAVPLNVGAIIYNTTLKQLEFWNGTVWAIIGTGGGGASPAGNGVVQFSNAAGNAFISGATLNTDAFGTSLLTQAQCSSTACELFTPANSTNGEAGESLPTLAGKISGMWIDHRGNRDSQYFTNPQPAPSFPTFSTMQAAHPINVLFTEPNPTSTAGTEQADRVKLDFYTSPGFSNGQAGCPLFCPPTGYASSTLWTIFSDIDDTVVINSAGIGDLRGTTCEFAGIGDHQCGIGGVFANYWGGYVAPSDEGLHALGSIHIGSGGDWVGQLTTITDANHIKSTQIANQGKQGQGRFLLDFTNIPKDAGGTSLGTTLPVDLITGPVNINIPGFITINSVTLPASTAVGTTTNDCTVPTQFGGIAIGQNSLVNGCNITVTSGAFIAGTSPVCMAHGSGNLFNIGMQMTSPPTALSGGHQTIFATMHRSVPAGSVVYQGGACSWGIILNGDVKSFQSQNNTTVFGSVFPIIGSEAHKMFYVNYDSSQIWGVIPNAGSQWGSRDTGNNPASHGFFFATLTRVGNLVTGITGSHGQANPPGWQLLNGAKFFSVSGCSDPTMNSTGVNSTIGMPGPEPNRIYYTLAGPDNVCTNALISTQDTTIGPVFLSEVYDVANHANGLAPYNVVDGTFALSYQPNFLVNDIIDSPTHYSASVDGLKISDEIAQPMWANFGIDILMQNVASYVGDAIRIDTSAQQNEQWGAGGVGYPITAFHTTGYIGSLIKADSSPAPGSSVLDIGFANGILGNPSTTNSSFRAYKVWALNSTGNGVAKDNLAFDADAQSYCWQFNFSGNCLLSYAPSGSVQTNTAEFLTPRFDLNVNGSILPFTQFTECSPINNNGGSPGCYNRIVTGNAIITQSGTPGTTQYNYDLAVNDEAGISFSPLMFTFTGNATLSGSNFNNIPCTDLPAGKTGTIYVFPNPVMASVGVCNLPTDVVHDTGSRIAVFGHTPMIDGIFYDSGGFRVPGVLGMFAFSDVDTFNNPFAVTASFSQLSNGLISLNGTARGDELGSLILNNLTVNGTCTGCTGGGGGTGTVTNVVIGNLAPLFTTSVATSTTTPTATFTLNALAAFISNANITIALPTSPITANTCTTPVATTMTGVATTNSFVTTFTTDPAAINGWGSTGGLVFTSWPTANTLNWEVCNQTASSITPGAISINVGVR